MAETMVGGRDWKGEYSTLVQKLGFDPRQPDPKRKHPRFHLEAPERTLLVHIGSITGVVNDISAGGVSFLSRASLTSDRLVKMSFDQKFTGQVKVVSNALAGTDFSTTTGLYRTGTRFVREDDGYRCMVQSLRLLSRIAGV
jgi:hypothetical protein